MKKYIMPQIEVMNVKASCDLLAGSAPEPGKYIPVVTGGDVTAD